MVLRVDERLAGHCQISRRLGSVQASPEPALFRKDREVTFAHKFLRFHEPMIQLAEAQTTFTCVE